MKLTKLVILIIGPLILISCGSLRAKLENNLAKSHEKHNISNSSQLPPGLATTKKLRAKLFDEVNVSSESLVSDTLYLWECFEIQSGAYNIVMKFKGKMHHYRHNGKTNDIIKGTDSDIWYKEFSEFNWKTLKLERERRLGEAAHFISVSFREEGKITTRMSQL